MVVVRWDNLAIGARAVLDPTGKTLPARAADTDFDVRPFDEGVDALIAALDAEESSPVEPERHPVLRKRPEPFLSPSLSLSRLRLVAVTASFLSAVLTSTLGLLSLASGTNWPVAVLSTSSVLATLGIAAFFTALQRSLKQKQRALHSRAVEVEDVHEALRRMAEHQVESLEARSLIRRSKGDPELAHALLMEIISEYEVGRERHLASAGHSPKMSVEQVMKTASEDHPVVQMLRRLASDVQEAL
ncbi:hypothetical protein ACF052_24950 [Streptomyces pilosus]|uniref:hypothetical protein n=1 Tax=Streptomyces pilosus TaxID=28893 RepID=UPI0037024D98